MKEQKKKLKNLKIDEHHHELLKTHCDTKGLKMFKFVEKLIAEHCKKERDLYGDYK